MLTFEHTEAGHSVVKLGEIPLFDVVYSHSINKELAQAHRDILESMVESVNRDQRMKGITAPKHQVNEPEPVFQGQSHLKGNGVILPWR